MGCDEESNSSQGVEQTCEVGSHRVRLDQCLVVSAKLTKCASGMTYLLPDYSSKAKAKNYDRLCRYLLWSVRMATCQSHAYLVIIAKALKIIE